MDKNLKLKVFPYSYFEAYLKTLIVKSSPWYSHKAEKILISELEWRGRYADFLPHAFSYRPCNLHAITRCDTRTKSFLQDIGATFFVS